MTVSLLVDAGEFRTSVERDIAAARDRVLLQTLSFEGDAVGRRLAAVLHRCRAPDRRVIVDSFNRVILSGRCVLAPSAVADPAMQREIGTTNVMLQRLHRRGVGVRLCAPLGRLLRRLPARNHKKSIVIDDAAAYIGGFNFTEHNFAWHDMMVRITDPAAVGFLRADLDSTWRLQPRSSSGSFAGLDIDILDGRTNPRYFARLFDAIAGARSEVFVHTPYLMFPFIERLAAAARRGVRIVVITPRHNTIPALRTYVTRAAALHGFELYEYPDRMSHLKAMLIDGETLVVGSSNFDYLSYRRHQEIVAYVRDARAIAEFRARVLQPDLERCGAVAVCSTSGGVLTARLRATSVLLAALSG